MSYKYTVILSNFTLLLSFNLPMQLQYDAFRNVQFSCSLKNHYGISAYQLPIRVGTAESRWERGYQRAQMSGHIQVTSTNKILIIIVVQIIT